VQRALLPFKTYGGMRMRFRYLFASALAVIGMTSAQAAVTPPNPNDLTQGKWELQVAKSKFCGRGPQKSTREIFEAGWGLISVIWESINADGKPTTSRYVYRYDGDKYPSNSDRVASEAITWKLVNPRRVEFVHWSKDNKITSEYVRAVSEDGQTMTQSAKFISPAPCDELQVFERR
jgi:hypothetical protein